MTGFTIYCAACGNTGCDLCSGERVRMIQQAATSAQADRIGELREAFIREMGLTFPGPAQANAMRDLIARAIAYGMRNGSAPAETPVVHESQVPVSRFSRLEWD